MTVMAVWHVNDGRLTHDNLPEPLTSLMSEPYPPFWWYISNGKLKHDGLPEPLTSFMDEPYPPFWWYISNGKLTHNGLPAPLARGSFANCVNFDTAHIPESVKSIGEYSFRNTALTSVTIASDCVYSSTSFPDGCEIHTYGEDESNE